MARLSVPPDSREGESFLIEGQPFKHATRVLRSRVGDTLTVVCGDGWEYGCVAEEVGSRSLRARIESRRELAAPPSREVHLYCALLKGEKLDLVLQKCTELGVAAVNFFHSQRCVARPDERRDRWQRIVESAAAQCGRDSVPQIGGPLAFEQATEQAAGQAGAILWESEQTRRLAEWVKGVPPTRPITLMVGPEGGFASSEVEHARRVGLTAITLGPRILRAETAAIVAPALILYASGDLG
jgi:16S rRNA (uracil1498-N3)-methyltransferase